MKTQMPRSKFQTERLMLTPTSLEDALFFLDLLNTPKWLEFIGDRQVKTLAAARAYIQEHVLPQYEKLGYGSYTVSLKKDSTKIGCCGLYDRKGLNGVDIGFSLLPDYERQGYGYEAASCIRDAAFSEFGLEAIGAITVKNNVASRGLLEKLGLVFERTVKLENDPEKLMYYEMKKSVIS